MVRVLIDSTIIVALITFFGVIFSSLVAPMILSYMDACRANKPETKEEETKENGQF